MIANNVILDVKHALMNLIIVQSVVEMVEINLTFQIVHAWILIMKFKIFKIVKVNKYFLLFYILNT